MAAAQPTALPENNYWSKSFKTIYCETYRCDPNDYVKRVFSRCLFWHAVPLAPIIARIDPFFFQEDLEFIREIGEVRNSGEFKSELNRFYGRNLRDQNWIRRKLLLRVSAKKLLKLKDLTFERWQQN